MDPGTPLDCGNSGTAMRLLLGVLAAAPWETVLAGDASLSSRPMERVARPLREMGAEVRTSGGHAPVEVRGGSLRGIRHVAEVPSAQVKGAVLLAGLAASGETEVVEPIPTRDHTERLLGALGLRIGGAARVRRGEVPGFAAEVPGDPSGAAFLAAAAVATGGAVRVGEVGVNPTRLAFLEVVGRMGASVRTETGRTSLDEPIGAISVDAGPRIAPVDLEAEEVARAIDEIPVLAVLAAFATGPSRFRGVGELRVKESDRVAGVVGLIRGLGGDAAAEGDDLVVGGGGLAGGVVEPNGDHRLAMAGAVAGLASAGEVLVQDAGCAEVSFPGFVGTLRRLGADVEG